MSGDASKEDQVQASFGEEARGRVAGRDVMLSASDVYQTTRLPSRAAARIPLLCWLCALQHQPWIPLHHILRSISGPNLLKGEDCLSSLSCHLVPNAPSAASYSSLPSSGTDDRQATWAACGGKGRPKAPLIFCASLMSEIRGLISDSFGFVRSPVR